MFNQGQVHRVIDKLSNDMVKDVRKGASKVILPNIDCKKSKTSWFTSRVLRLGKSLSLSSLKLIVILQQDGQQA